MIVRIPHKKVTAMMANNTYLKGMLGQRSTFRYLVRSIALHPIFKTLPLKLSKYLARHVTKQSFSEKSMIFNLQDTVSGIHIIIAGKACYLAENNAGKKFTLLPLQSNSLAGDLLLQGTGATLGHELFAVTKVYTLFMPLEPLLNISAAFPPLIHRLTQYAEQQQQQIALSLSELKHD
ncbi:MAG: hypothetical protein Q9N67_07775 [Ghiorsea sp.]|nr:hypothetical protein [Ghiorsea sp.]